MKSCDSNITSGQESPPNLSSKFKSQVLKPSWPNKVEEKQVKNILQTELRVNETSPTIQKRKKFVPRKKSRKKSTKKNSKRGTLGGEKLGSSVMVDLVSKLTSRVKLSVNRFLMKVRRQRIYQDHQNLRSSHYEIIGDQSAFYGESLGKNFKKQGNFGFLNSLLFSLAIVQLKVNSIIAPLKKFVLVLNKSIPIINPNGFLKIIWDCFLLLLTVFQLFVFSIEISFDVEFDIFTFNYFFTIMLGINILVNMNTKVFKDGIEIIERRKIFKNYFRKKIFADAVPSAFMLAATFIFTKTIQNYAYLILLIKLAEGRKIKKRLELLVNQNAKAIGTLKLMILLWKIFICGHLIACCWHYIGYLSSRNPGENNNWLKAKGIENEAWNTRYLFSIYWAMTTMLTVGYGDVSPTNKNEVFFNIWAMFVGCGVFGYSMTSIGEIFKNANQNNTLLMEQMKRVSAILRDKCLPVEFQSKVKRYLEYVWKQEQRDDPAYEQLIMGKLSNSLKEEMLLYTNVKHLKKIPALLAFSEKTLLLLSKYMKKVRFSPEEQVYREGDTDSLCLYFVLEGTFQLTASTESNQTADYIKWTTFKKDEAFGVNETFTGKAREHSVVSLDFTTAFKLLRVDIIQVLKKCPPDFEKYCQIKDLELLYDNLTPYNQKCSSCGFRDHKIKNCKFLNYIPNKLTVLEKYRAKRRIFSENFKRSPAHSSNALIFKNKNIKALNELLDVYNDDEEIIQLAKLYNSDEFQRHRTKTSQYPEEIREAQIAQKLINLDNFSREKSLSQELMDTSPKRNQSNINRIEIKEEAVPIKYTDTSNVIDSVLSKYAGRNSNLSTQIDLFKSSPSSKHVEKYPVQKDSNKLAVGFGEFIKDRLPSNADGLKIDHRDIKSYTQIPLSPSNRDAIPFSGIENFPTQTDIRLNMSVESAGRQRTFKVSEPVRFNEALEYFDQMRSYDFYFPNNNMERVLQKLYPFQPNL